jgi:imidazolonepropionase-like amidohydrolase
VDAHVHLGFDGGPDPVARMKAETDTEQLILMLRSARELLSVGVTTARDLGARSFLDIAVAAATATGMAEGPRLLTAARPLTRPAVTAGSWAGSATPRTICAGWSGCSTRWAPTS